MCSLNGGSKKFLLDASSYEKYTMVITFIILSYEMSIYLKEYLDDKRFTQLTKDRPQNLKISSSSFEN